MNMHPEEFIISYEAALASQNWDNVEPLVHANACVTFSNGTVHKGLKAIKVAFTNNFSLIKDEKYFITDVHWVVKDKEFAVYLFNFNWSGFIDGQQASGSGRGSTTLIFEKGKWLLVSEHLGSAN
jgi:ketosteroid isomerase-like protein